MNSLTISQFPALSYACDEAINALCTNLSFSGEGVRKILVTSCHAAEGKSFLTMNIMRTMAKFGKSVALVDTDLRRSVITMKYGVRYAEKKEHPGLAHFLAGMAKEDDVIYETNIPGAYMVPIGRAVNNPLPLLNSQRLGDLLDHLAANVDYVLVDAPPIGMVIDAAQVAKFCDGTLLVVTHNSVHRKELIGAKEQLEQTGCPILGTVLNMVEFDNYLSKKYYYRSHYYNYGYGYYTHSDSSGAGENAKMRKPKA